jgi:uncharacterized protein involved in exopolysaccharide biosynthesis
VRQRFDIFWFPVSSGRITVFGPGWPDSHPTLNDPDGNSRFIEAPKTTHLPGWLQSFPTVTTFLIGLFMTSSTQLTLSQLFGAVYRHRYKSLLSFLVVMILVVAAFVLLPRKYGSEGKLYVRLGRNHSTLSPATGSASVSIQDTRETEIRSVVEIITSRAVLEAVVDEIGAEAILENPMDEWMPDLSISRLLPVSKNDGGVGLSSEEYAMLRDREKAAKALATSIDVHAEKNTSVISIYAKSHSAELAQRIVNTVIDYTRDVHLKIHSADVSAVFFDDQFETQERTLVEAVKKQAEFRNQRKVLSVGAERATLQEIVSRLENDILGAEVDVARTQESLKQLQKMMASTEAQIAVPTTGVERLSYEDSRTEVFKLETERARLVSTYSELHPLVQQIDQQLIQARKTLESMVDNRTESAMMSNPVYEAVRVDLVRAETQYAGALARLNSLQQKQVVTQERLLELNDADVRADQLQRDIDVARQYLDNYTRKRGEAIAMTMLDASKISDIVVAQAATLGLKHISPRGSMILPLGLLIGMLAAVATSLFCERNHLSPSLNEGDVEQIIGLPVLVTLPRVYSSRNMVN